MTTACYLCGKTTALMQCKKCKSAHYCTRECQVQDWEEHKTICKHKEFAGAPCDVCQDTEEDIVDACHECGFIFCKVCDIKTVHHDSQGEEISLGSCPGCETPRHVCQRDEYLNKLKNLIKERKGDPREARWLTILGFSYQASKLTEQMAKKCYLRAGELGLGEGYCRLAEMYTHQREWDEARRYYRKAAERMHVIAIQVLGVEAEDGYFHFEAHWRQSQQSPTHSPDLNEAFRLFREGASLGDIECSFRLGGCFLHGAGTKTNFEKAFKWIQKAVEKGHAGAMIMYCQFYRRGCVVEQSNVQTKYWLERALESEEGSEEEKALARELFREYNL